MSTKTVKGSSDMANLIEATGSRMAIETRATREAQDKATVTATAMATVMDMVTAVAMWKGDVAARSGVGGVSLEEHAVTGMRSTLLIRNNEKKKVNAVTDLALSVMEGRALHNQIFADR